MLWYELTRWWAYRRIKHPKMRLYVWWWPLAIAGVATSIVSLMPKHVPISGESGVLTGVISTLAILPGFFIAALAAVSTFQRPEMDTPMPRPTPTVQMRFEDKYVATELSRRMFLSYLFSYLSIVSLILVVICQSANLIAPSFSEM